MKRFVLLLALIGCVGLAVPASAHNLYRKPKVGVTGEVFKFRARSGSRTRTSTGSTSRARGTTLDPGGPLAHRPPRAVPPALQGFQPRQAQVVLHADRHALRERIAHRLPGTAASSVSASGTRSSVPTSYQTPPLLVQPPSPGLVQRASSRAVGLLAEREFGVALRVCRDRVGVRSRGHRDGALLLRRRVGQLGARLRVLRRKLSRAVTTRVVARLREARLDGRYDVARIGLRVCVVALVLLAEEGRQGHRGQDPEDRGDCQELEEREPALAPYAGAEGGHFAPSIGPQTPKT